MSAGRFKTVEFPLPPLDEQRRIVAEIDRRLSLIEAMHVAIENAARRSSSLRRMILQSAFRGELVPQDRTDEPATALLESIASERAGDTRDKRRKALA